MEKPKFFKLGNPFSKMGEIYIAKDIEGVIQMSVDVMKTTLQANNIVVTPLIERELTEYFTAHQDAYDKEVLSEGVPEKLTTMLCFTRKRDLVNYCKRITISEQELYLLIHNCSLIGYKRNSKFPEYLPENRKLTKSDRLLVNQDHRYPRASSWFFAFQASLDLKLGKYYFKNGGITSPLHSPTCKHVGLCPLGFR